MITTAPGDLTKMTETMTTTTMTMTTTTSIDDLPNELLISIFDLLPRHLLVDVVSSVCFRWRRLASAPLLWGRINLGAEFDHDGVGGVYRGVDDDEGLQRGKRVVVVDDELWMLQRGFDSVVRDLHLKMRNPFDDFALGKLQKVLKVCRCALAQRFRDILFLR